MFMYGKDNTLEEKLEFLLEQFTFEEVLEMNDISESEILKLLFHEGLLHQPERMFEDTNGNDHS
jgi:beta-N-acetylglucosaminidase